MNISIKLDCMNQNDYFCLKKDVELLKKYDNFFVAKTSNKGETLIPQFWWGNITDPKIIVLANNPSYRSEDKYQLSDDRDNENYREYLKNNICRPTEFNCNFIKENTGSYFSYWWNNNFFDNKPIKIEKVGIFNLIGYYSKNSSFFNKEILTHSHMIKFANKLKKYIQSSDEIVIVFVWKGSVDYWRSALGKDVFNKIFKNKKIYIANKGHRFNPKFNGACRYFINDNRYDETDLLDIKDLIKQ